MDVQSYYDDFSRRYETKRGAGYHALIDDLEAGLVAEYAAEGARILEVGCGTGLIMTRLQRRSERVVGVDLSRSMLASAQARGHTVAQVDVLALPFASASFDVVCSFKVLAHVPRIGEALAEMARVVTPGGLLIADFYNRLSLRFLAKTIAGPRQTGLSVSEADVPTRWDLPWRIGEHFPPDVRILSTRGVRVLTPFAAVLDLPLLGPSLRRLEQAATSMDLSGLVGGFVVAVGRKS